MSCNHNSPRSTLELVPQPCSTSNISKKLNHRAMILNIATVVMIIGLLKSAESFLMPQSQSRRHFFFGVSSRYNNNERSTVSRRLFTPKKEREPSIDLTGEQDKALRDASRDLEVLFGPRWLDDSEAWDQARTQFVVLTNYSDAELRTAYIRQGPRLLDVITETPLGPIVLINLVA